MDCVVTFSGQIVSLCPSTTETLIEFGLSEQICGITKFCIHPESVVKNLSSVGGTKDPDLGRIRELAPDLIFMNSEENRREDYESLAKDFNVDVSEPKSVAEIPALLRHFGALTRREAPAEHAAQKLERALQTLRKARGRRTSLFSYVYLIWRKPWMSVGTDTYVSRLFEEAGGTNIFGDQNERYPEISLQEIAGKKPDYIFLADEPFPFSQKHIPEVKQACPQAKVEVIDGDDCCWHGVRSIRGVEFMQSLLERLAELDT